MNKGISIIEYNSLNLPQELAIKNTNASGKIYYTYSASGAKLKTVHLSATNQSVMPTIGVTTNDASFYKKKTTDYVGNMIYENGTLKRTLIDGGYVENNVYHFYLTDHLGNNRVVAKADGTVMQKNHYYPFGMAFTENTKEEQTRQPYKLGNKELDQELGISVYDFEARQLTNGVPRFTSVDPHAENYYSWSPYAYVGNNPINIIDPNGMDWVYRTVDGVTEVYYDRSVTSQEDVNKKYGEKGGVTHLSTGTTLSTYSTDGSIKSQYTFANDNESNKYGTVTDMNGNTLDNSKIEYGKYYTIFGTSDNSVNAETLHNNLMGSYIGQWNPKSYSHKDSYQYQSRNISDYGAMLHDIDFDTLGAKGPTDAQTQPADAKLAANSLQAVFYNNSTKDRGRAALVYGAMSTIATYKYPFYKVGKNASKTAVQNVYSSQMKFGW